MTTRAAAAAVAPAEHILIERPLPAVTKFYGDSPALVQDFDREIRAAWKCCHDDRGRCLDVLQRNVSADIRGFLRMQAEDVQQDPEKALAAILAAYGEQRQPVQIQDELAAQRQRPEESVRSFSIRLHQLYSTLVSRQKQLGDTATSDRYVRDVFIRGLHSKAATNQLHTRVLDDPALSYRDTVEQAVRLCGVLPMEANIAAVTTSNPALSGTESLVLKQLEMLGKMFERVEKHLEAPTAPAPRRQGPVRCYNCEKLGHIARECRLPPQHAAARPPRASRRHEPAAAAAAARQHAAGNRQAEN